ncbi:N-acetylglucosamine-6-phosphate deacetylase [Dethiosulfovibrio salsuginis]|uniref:N-acetylglucosamine-6-phosphate deacetylase n=1 Tax=Dethiosulfovibrio salsuginis TaxID=561720 RepID=UPI000A1CEE73|nr:N-acetylglucosamine-6-phosphate deacetylase [Dethiosulfovibrio salsuginis]
MELCSLCSEGGESFLLKGGLVCYPWGFQKGDLFFGRSIGSLDDIPQARSNLTSINCDDVIVSPGFVDIHVHGSDGGDVMDGSLESLETMARSMIPTGVTSFIGATMSYPLSSLEEVLSVAAKYRREQLPYNGKAVLLGVHLEGPFLSPFKAGAHIPGYLIDPDPDFVISHRDIVKIVTLAPERDGALSFIALLKSVGINISIGHTVCDYDKAMSAIALGASGFTHLYNAMSPMGHRNPGAVGAAFDSRCWCELIFDGVHVHPAAIRTACKAIAPDRVILITDSIRARGLGDGSFDLGGLTVKVTDDRAELPDGTLAGSVLTMIKGIKNAVEWGALSLHQALNGASLNPAKYIGDDTIGRLERGCKGDVVLIDRDTLSIQGVFVGGELSFCSEWLKSRF